MRTVLADAAEVAHRALVALEPDGVGVHLGVSAEDDTAATHRFEATLPGYRGWQWAVVVAAPPGADHATVSESALLPGPDALIAPEFIPWEQRVRPGDLGPGDLLAPPAGDPRLVPGYVATGDPVVDEVAREVGLGRVQVLSLEGRVDAAQRWYSEYGPETEMAKAAPGTCGMCGFYVPLAGALRESFGVCANAMGADGHVVHIEYGCGAHSDVAAPSGNGSPRYEAFDDHAVDYVEIVRPAGRSDLDADQQAPVAGDPQPEAQAGDQQSSAEVGDQPTGDQVAVQASDQQETAEAEAVDAAAADRAALAEGAAPVSAHEAAAAEAAGDGPAAEMPPTTQSAEAKPVTESAEAELTTHSAEAEANSAALSAEANSAALSAETNSATQPAEAESAALSAEAESAAPSAETESVTQPAASGSDPAHAQDSPAAGEHGSPVEN